MCFKLISSMDQAEHIIPSSLPKKRGKLCKQEINKQHKTRRKTPKSHSAMHPYQKSKTLREVMDPYKVLGVPASQARWGKIPLFCRLENAGKHWITLIDIIIIVTYLCYSNLAWVTICCGNLQPPKIWRDFLDGLLTVLTYVYIAHGP